MVAVSLDRKSTRLNSSHTIISYAVFCLKKKINEAAGPQRPRAGPPRGHERPRTPGRGGGVGLGHEGRGRWRPDHGAWFRLLFFLIPRHPPSPTPFPAPPLSR